MLKRCYITGMSKRELNGFEQRELLGKKYWDDPRWKTVRKLRDEGKQSEANGLVMIIRDSWGVD